MRQHVAATGQPRTIYLALVLGAALLTSHAYAQTTYSAVAPLAAQAPAAEGGACRRRRRCRRRHIKVRAGEGRASTSLPRIA